MSNLSEILSTKFVLQLTWPHILCWIAIIPFVIVVVAFFADLSFETKFMVYMICSIIQQILFTIATIMWAISEAKLHIFPTIAIFVWLASSVRNAYRLADETRSNSRY